jgi:hypothetical protein
VPSSSSSSSSRTRRVFGRRAAPAPDIGRRCLLDLDFNLPLNLDRLFGARVLTGRVLIGRELLVQKP